MGLKHITVAMALLSSAFAAPHAFSKRDECQDAYQGCLSSGAAEVVCQCDLAVCYGEDNQRTRDYCSSAIAALPYPSATSIPGGCNPAHPGSCPTSTAVNSIPGGCNPAHPGSCPTSSTTVAAAATTTVNTIPGGCNPAHPGSCPTSSTTAAAAATTTVDACQKDYQGCISSGAAEVVCQCDLATCYGEDNQRTRDYCSSAIAALPYPSSHSIPGGCNPAHPGSCPTTTLVTSVATSVSGIPGGCNPAHPGSCPTTTTTVAAAATTTANTIPGGCNPAHPGSCPTATAGAAPAASAAAAGAASSPVPVSGLEWSIKNMTRYCSEDNSGCDYNFVISTPTQTERCTVSRMPGSNAATESWSNQQCEKTDFYVSWGYVTEPAPAFAVITVVEGKELAWFGVSDVNGGKVTANSPFGSGSWPLLGPDQVYTY